MQALNNKPITIYGKGEHTRSFCYVDDLIEAMMIFMKTENKFTGPLNLGNPSEISILELAETVLLLSGSKSELVFNNLPEDDPKQRRPDISLAKEKLNWEPKIGLKEGLNRTIEYFDTLLQIPKAKSK